MVRRMDLGRRIRSIWMGEDPCRPRHSPAIIHPLSARTSSLTDCDAVDRFRRVCLDAGSARLDQIAWAHFYRQDDTTMLQIAAATVLPQVDPSDLFF